MQLGGRVGGYRKKGNNKAIDDYRVNPIGQRNHPRIYCDTDSSDRLCRGDYAKGRQRYFRNTPRSRALYAVELRVNFSVDTNSRFHASSFFLSQRNDTCFPHLYRTLHAHESLVAIYA